MSARIITAIVAFGVVAGALAAPAPSVAQTVLRAVSFLPLNDNEVSMPMFHQLMDEINATVKGVRIEHIGGPEVIPPQDQAAGVGRGIADITVTHTMHNSIVPEIGTLPLSRLTPAQEREIGYLDMLDQAHAKMNLKVLGRIATDVGFHIFSKNKIATLEDFKGAKMRSHGGTHEFFRRLGATPVNLAISEIFAGLDRGLVVGAPYPLSASGQGLHEVTKYVLMDALWPAHTTVVLINRSKWDSLPEEARKSITDIQIKLEKVMAERVAALKKQDLDFLKAKGMEFVSLSADDKATWLKVANESRWAPIEKQLPPERIAALKMMIEQGKKP
jgi:TRAP-type C4-dicarboxylate transport system substrate-binding protein